MFHVVGCITGEHDLRLVALAGVMCLFACSTAMSMLARAGASGKVRARALWIASAGLVAGCGIWATHFIAMLAYRPGFPVGYDTFTTALSILIAISLCGLGFAVALEHRRPLLGGAVAGGAICAMHYVGMAALRVPAVMIWDERYVAASIVIGVVPMMFGMRYVVTRHTLRAYGIGTAVFTLAICAMHFTGMSAVSYRLYPLAVSDAVLEPTALAIAVAAVSAFVVALGLIVALVDHHLALRAGNEAQRLRAHIAELEATKAALETTSRDLRAALLAADSANKAKSSFLAAMSHELRTPLNAVIGFSELIESETFGPLGNPRYRAYAGDIRQSGAHLLALINDILELSRLDASQAELQEEVFALDEVVREALKMVTRQAETGSVALFDRLEAGLPAVKADRRRIKQVLINLLANAVKFTPPGGKVEVLAHQSEDGLSVTIRDTGIGIAAADIPKAFERFGQVDSALSRKYGGTGLGLPLSKDLMELHGGRLSLESEVNRGTSVTIMLPAERIVARKTAVA